MKTSYAEPTKNAGIACASIDGAKVNILLENSQLLIAEREKNGAEPESETPCPTPPVQMRAK
jgi:hypothetical protein